MKVMKNKWCWIGLVLCTSSLAWAAKDKTPKSDSDTKGSTTEDSASSDSSDKDESADEDEAPKAAPKKSAKAEVKADLEPSESKKIEVAVLGSYGGSTFTKLGAGLRLGMDWGPTEGLYLGLIGTYYTGTTKTQDRLSGTAERTRGASIVAAEAGYNVELASDFLVRPYLSPGVAMVADKTCATGTCWNENGVKLTISPGVQAAYLVSSFLYVGGDLRYQIIMNTADATTAVISLTAGLRL